MVTVLGVIVLVSFVAFCLGITVGIKAEQEWQSR